MLSHTVEMEVRTMALNLLGQFHATAREDDLRKLYDEAVDGIRQWYDTSPEPQHKPAGSGTSDEGLGVGVLAAVPDEMNDWFVPLSFMFTVPYLHDGSSITSSDIQARASSFIRLANLALRLCRNSSAESLDECVSGGDGGDKPIFHIASLPTEMEYCSFEFDSSDHLEMDPAGFQLKVSARPTSATHDAGPTHLVAPSAPPDLRVPAPVAVFFTDEAPEQDLSSGLVEEAGCRHHPRMFSWANEFMASPSHAFAYALVVTGAHKAS
jgi:hypothetical protein